MKIAGHTSMEISLGYVHPDHAIVLSSVDGDEKIIGIDVEAFEGPDKSPYSGKKPGVKSLTGRRLKVVQSVA